MKRIRIFVILAAAFTLLVAGTVLVNGQTAQSPLPAPTGYVNDYAKVVDRPTKDRLETTLGNLDRQHQIQLSVVTVETTGGQDIFDYSLAVARGWGIGSKDTQKPSLLLLVAIKDRKYYTQVSRHLEGDIPDGLAGQIQRERLVPAFRAGEYGKGLADTVEAYVREIAEKRGFSTDTIFPAGTGTRREAKRPSSPTKSLWGSCCIGIFVLGILAIFAILARRGGRGGGWGGGNLGGLVTGLLLGSLLNSGRRSSGWGGGGFGGFGGGSSGSGGGGFGGFGGGGDFGGGGAGGSW